MRLLKITTLIFFIIYTCVSCAVLKPATIAKTSPMSNYKYVYITPTFELTSSTGSVYGGDYGVYGSTQTKSINPSDIISGGLLKRGMIRLPEIKPELTEETIIVNYGESGRRNIMGGLWGYTIEVTLQFISAETKMPICIVSAEGMGSTEADDIRIAINRCLDKVFE